MTKPVKLINDHDISSRSPREGDSYELFHLRTPGGEGLGIVARLVEKDGRPYHGAQSLNFIRRPRLRGEYWHLSRRSAFTLHRGEGLPVGVPHYDRVFVPLTRDELEYLGF